MPMLDCRTYSTMRLKKPNLLETFLLKWNDFFVHYTKQLYYKLNLVSLNALHVLEYHTYLHMLGHNHQGMKTRHKALSRRHSPKRFMKDWSLYLAMSRVNIKGEIQPCAQKCILFYFVSVQFGFFVLKNWLMSFAKSYRTAFTKQVIFCYSCSMLSLHEPQLTSALLALYAGLIYLDLKR